MAKIFKLFPWVVLLLLALDFYLIFIFAPEEVGQGLVQKIFYFHVSSAFAMYFGFILAGIFSVLYLIQRKRIWDCFAQAGVSTGLLFCAMVLASGPIWAKPIWGTWWTWDPRLTTTFLTWLIFLSTILLRSFFGDDPRGRVYAAVLTLFGVVDIPLIFLSVKIWRGIHPTVLGQKGNMPFEMKMTLILSNLTVMALFLLIYWLRYKCLWLEERVREELEYQSN